MAMTPEDPEVPFAGEDLPTEPLPQRDFPLADPADEFEWARPSWAVPLDETGDGDGAGPPADAEDTVEAPAVDVSAPVSAGPEFVTPVADDPLVAPVLTPGAGRGRVLALAGCMLATGLLGGFVGARIAEDDDFRPAALPPISRSSTSRVSSPGSLADVVERVSPAVVGIRSRGARLGIGQGTGFIYSPEGEIVTNSHVINGARTILVTLPGEDQARDAEVIGNDEDEDLAVVRVKGVTGLPTVEVGDSRSVRIGEEVFAIGHALGLSGGPSVSRGVVSGLQRANGPLAELIQTDAALNPGNSGGPLFDGGGRVIGVNTMVRAGAENIGFAIPMERVRTIVDRLREGKPTPPMAFLGVRTQAAEDGGPGAEVLDVTGGTPAAEAGLVEGDRIVAVDGERVSGPESLANLIRTRNPGQKVEVAYRRAGEERVATVTLATKDPEVN